MPHTDFQIMSDLHLETPLARPTYDNFAQTIIPQSPYLALLGDIGYACDTRLFEFLEEQLHHFQIVFFLLGNHEAYGTSVPATKALVEAFAARMDEMRSVLKNLGRFVFLDQTRYDIDDGMTVLGCTLFSRVLEEQEGTVKMFVTDFSSIENWEICDHNMAHEGDVNWLNTQVESIMKSEPGRTIVIFTHHSPTLLEAATDPIHTGDSAQVTSAFATDLSKEICWSSAQVKLWAFGHTHFNCDFEDPHTKKRIFANQKGYRRAESLTFDATKIVHVDTYTSSASKEETENQDQVARRSRWEHKSRTPGNKCMIM